MARVPSAALTLLAVASGCGGKTAGDGSDTGSPEPRTVEPSGSIASEPEPAPLGPIMDREAWQALTADDPFDPLGEHSPGCGAQGFRIQQESPQATDDNPDGILPTVATDSCGFVSASQPAIRAIRAGEIIEATVFHFRLWSPTVAEARIVVRLGDDDVLNESLRIDDVYPSDSCPSDVQGGFCHTSGLLTDRLMVERDLPLGTPLYFHVDNHGDNLYWLIELRPVES